MKGSSHLTIGAAAGLGAAVYLHTDPFSTVSLVGLGALSGLAPDLDVNGKLSNRITVSKKWLITFFSAAGILLSIYSYLEKSGFMQSAGIAIGLCLLLLPRLFIKQRTMLFLTGVFLFYIGWQTNVVWVMLLSVFIAVSSFLSHRTLTHSIIGVACFGFIGWHFEQSVHLEGSFITAVAGYASHLVADMKVWPVNKRGVKWFLPFFQKEF
ncbi:inner membrane protein [Bacillus ectoiniformans]|uniref:metal-dependent hydrolase n=1 Tax=Bacillus ectoiniformans TaxID=1494429 RepID=UPI00195C908A|nr:metal-dependent hydrolase [Bacillus ectoiniformans]MBM7649197.1 inner membrane protein [Bacillus ectoiniformans]